MGSLSRRGLIRLSAVAGVAAASACGGPGVRRNAAVVGLRSGEQPNGALGANFNGDPSMMTWAQLREAEATWVRGFAAMPEFDEQEPAAHRAIKTLLEAGRRDLRTVLSLKFPYFPRDGHDRIPRPGTPEMDADLRRVDAVLSVVMDQVDILVIGNEPFIECPEDDWTNGAINDFYETIARHVIDYRTRNFPNGGKTVLHMGALNHLDEPGKWVNSGTDRWMRFVRETPEIAGTDIHPHVAAPDGARAYLDYVLPRLGDKRFLVTEFSLVHLWKDHLEDPVSTAYADEYEIPRDTPVWQVIRNALRDPFPKERWYAFLRTSPWFENNKHYLTDQMAEFRATGRLAVATYGIGQDEAMSGADFNAESTPWLLNSVYASATIRPGPDGSAVPNYAWLPEFKALQHS